MNELLKKIRSRGHWQVIVRPTTFVEKRVQNLLELETIVTKSSVQLRGWDYPHVDPRIQVELGIDWVGQASEVWEFIEVWRIYQSGQFFHTFAMTEDWPELSTSPYPLMPGEGLALRNTVFTLTEIFEFASRLSGTAVGDDAMNVELKLCQLDGRTLFNDKPNGRPLRVRPATIKEFPYETTVTRLELLARPRELALEPAVELFRHFGQEFSPQTLRGLQEELERFRTRATV